MYSVEDLLISHGYKLPRKHSPPPAPRRVPGEGGPPYGYPSRSSSALGSLTSASASSSSNSQRDLAHSHGRSVLTDPGFYDAHRGVYVQPHSGDRGITYWKRRGQDFSALLDYADGRVPMGMQRAEGRGSLTARERELALQQWRLAAERKQHGGGEPGREKWAAQHPQHPQHPQHQHHQQQQEQQQQHQQAQQQVPRRPRTAEGAVPPRTKAKSQSLPRMALPAPMPPPLHGSRPCLSAGPSSLQLHHEGGVVWMANPASAGGGPQVRIRQSRPPRPPSYEVHQQTRGGNPDGHVSRAPSRQEYCPSEPPGYMPPPSYRRQPIMPGAHAYREILAGYMYRNDAYQHTMPLSEGVQWYARQAGTSWPDHHHLHHADGRRSAPCRAVFPVYSEDGRGVVQYIPFDDPRVRHISGGLLTDADKIRNIQNEIPGISVSEQSPDDSAFLSPQESVDSSDVTTPCHAQWPSYPDNLSSAPDLNRNPGDLNRNPSDLTSDLPTIVGGVGKRQPVSSRQSSSSDQGFSETITQVKKFEPELDGKKPARRRQKETMFCLVSVPITPQVARDNADQNNNNKAPSPTVIPTVMAVVTQSSNQSNPVNQPGTSVALETRTPAPSSPLGSHVSRRAPLRRELVDAWTLQSRCQGAWPGDQYRNQHTQTGSPEITRALPAPPSSSQTAPEAPSSDSTTDSGLGTDCCPPYALPMKGQRSISPSTTSAFSRTGQPNQPSPTRLRSPPTSPRAPQPSPRRSLPRTPSDGGGGGSGVAGGGSQGEVFGQFLLKPVGRRPWDAIEELESFNKESLIVQEPTPGRQNDPEPNHVASDEEAPADGETELEHKDEVDNMDISPIVDDWGLSELVSLYRRTRSSPCWPEGQTAGDSCPSPRQGGPALLAQPLSSPSAVERQDIPVPQESLLRDVGLTVYTPDPHKGAQEESSNSSSLTMTADTQPAREVQSEKHVSRDAPRAGETANTDKREAPNPERMQTSVTVRRQRFRFSSEGPTFLTESLTVFSPDGQDGEEDEVLEALLSKVKKRPPSEDLSPLYQVQSASGIPQNESIEERAARILGISVPAESLVSRRQAQTGDTLSEVALANQSEMLVSADLVLTNQSEEEVKDEPPKPDGAETEDGAEERKEGEEGEEASELQGEVEEGEQRTEAAAVEPAAPGEPTDEVEPENVSEGERGEASEGESGILSEALQVGDDEAISVKQTEDTPSGDTTANEEEPAELSITDHRTAGEEDAEAAVGGGDDAQEEAAGSDTETIAGAVSVGGEKEVETVEVIEEIPDEEVQQVSGELAELRVEETCPEVEEEVREEEVEVKEVRQEEEEVIEEVEEVIEEEEVMQEEVKMEKGMQEELEAGSPDSYIAIATLEMPEILSIVEEEDEEAEMGSLYSARMGGKMDMEEASSYMPSYLTLSHVEREEEEEEKEQEEQVKLKEERIEGEEKERLMERGEEDTAEKETDEREKMTAQGPKKEKEEEEEGEASRGRQSEEDVGEERSERQRRPLDESEGSRVRPTPLPRSTVVKREIRLPLEALEDPDTYPTSESYDPSRVERV